MPDPVQKAAPNFPLILVSCDSLEHCEKIYGKGFRARVEELMSASGADISTASRQVHAEIRENSLKRVQTVLNTPLDGAPPSEVWK